MTHSARPEPATVSLPELATLYAAHAPRPKLRPAPRRRRRQGGHGLIMAFAAVVVVAFVVRMSLRGNLVAPWSQPEPPARASTRAIRPTAPEPAVVRKARPESPERPTGGQVTPGFSTATGPDAAARKTPTVASLPGLVPAPTIGTKPVDSAAQVAAAPPRPVAPYALEVATFIFEDRARMERDRLSASGLRARVVTTVEYGSRVYRVVLSGYVDPAAAERAADSLLTTGAVLQARVIRFP